MSEVQLPPAAARRLPWGSLALVGVLLVVGVGYAAWVVLKDRQSSAETNVADQAREYLRGKNVQPLSEPLTKLLAVPESTLVKSQAHRLLNQPAPDFELSDPFNRTYRLQALLEKGPVVLIFYYGYHCNHCVGQLFAVQDDVTYFKELGAQVVAVSADPTDVTLQRFKQYGAFAFPVLSDAGNKVAETYGVFAPARGGKREDLQHGTFVIGRDGRVRWCNVADEPFTNNRVLLVEVARAEGRWPTGH
jgi:peroxiredoxin